MEFLSTGVCLNASVLFPIQQVSALKATSHPSFAVHRSTLDASSMMEGTDEEPVGRATFQQQGAECKYSCLSCRISAGPELCGLGRLVVTRCPSTMSMFLLKASLFFISVPLVVSTSVLSFRLTPMLVLLFFTFSLPSGSILARQIDSAFGSAMGRVWISAIPVLPKDLPGAGVFHCGVRVGYFFAE